MSRSTPTLDPSKLTFHDDENYISNGHLCLTVTYPSDSTPDKEYTLCVRDDGTIITQRDEDEGEDDPEEDGHDATCPGYVHYGACLHSRGGAEMVREYWRRHFRERTSTDILREDSWLVHQPFGSLTTVQHLMLDAIGDVVAERFAKADDFAARWAARQGRAS